MAGPFAVAITAIYALLALRRVYGGRAWVTALRLAAAGLAYTLAGFLPLLVAAFVWTVLTS